MFECVHALIAYFVVSVVVYKDLSKVGYIVKWASTWDKQKQILQLRYNYIYNNNVCNGEMIIQNCGKSCCPRIQFFPVHLFGKIGKWEAESIVMFCKRRQILQPHMMRQ